MPPKKIDDKKQRGPGRPTDYSEEVAETLCLLIAEGESLRAICDMDDMPAKATVFRWLARYPEFRDKYTRAKELGSEVHAEEMLEIADDATNDWMEAHNADGEAVGYKLNGEHVQRSKLRIDTRKWLLAKLQPKKYGDKVDLNHGAEEGSPLARLLDRMGASPKTLRPSQED